MGRSRGRKKLNVLDHWDKYFEDGTLEDWQRLCCDLRLDRCDLGSKTKCRKVLKTVHVNIKQFLNAREKPDDVIFFRNNQELLNWTAENHAFFPRAKLDKGHPLRSLLRRMR